MCRIIPPEGWVPPFTINEDAFKFPTRLQNLSRLGVRAYQDIWEREREGGTTSIHPSIHTPGRKPTPSKRERRTNEEVIVSFHIRSAHPPTHPPTHRPRPA